VVAEAISGFIIVVKVSRVLYGITGKELMDRNKQMY
jgi:hypothetical protein